MSGGFEFIDNDNLLLLIGEELKQPLITIKQISELRNKDPQISAHAQKALRTIDNILIYRKFNSGQTALKLEPVHVGQAIHDVSVEMRPIMRAAGCRTDIKIQKSLSTVDVDRELIQGALQGMWQALIGTLSEPSTILCSAKKTKGGIRLSVTSKDASVNKLHLNTANTKSSQPITSIPGPATDLLTAGGMLNLQGYILTKTINSANVGFGVTLKASRQMQIV